MPLSSIRDHGGSFGGGKPSLNSPYSLMPVNLLFPRNIHVYHDTAKPEDYNLLTMNSKYVVIINKLNSRIFIVDKRTGLIAFNYYLMPGYAIIGGSAYGALITQGAEVYLVGVFRNNSTGYNTILRMRVSDGTWSAYSHAPDYPTGDYKIVFNSTHAVITDSNWIFYLDASTVVFKTTYLTLGIGTTFREVYGIYNNLIYTRGSTSEKISGIRFNGTLAFSTVLSNPSTNGNSIMFRDKLIIFYNGRLQVHTLTDSGFVPETGHLTDYFQLAYAQLLDKSGKILIHALNGNSASHGSGYCMIYDIMTKTLVQPRAIGYGVYAIYNESNFKDLDLPVVYGHLYEYKSEYTNTLTRSIHAILPVI